MNTEVRMAHLTSAELARRIQERPVVVVPTGSTEVLGTHGVLGADNIVAERASVDLARAVGCVTAPPIPYGDAFELRHWPGTVTIRPEVLTQFYSDVADSLCQSGFSHLFFLNIHSMNGGAVDNCCRGLRARGVAAASGSFWKVASSVAGALVSDVRHPTGHGGELITSVLMALDESAVRSEATHEVPKPGADFYFSHLPGSSTGLSVYGDFTDYCESGAWGETHGATVERGRAIYLATVDRLAEFVREFCDL